MLVEPGTQSPLDSATLSDSLFGVAEDPPIRCLPCDGAEGEESLATARLVVVWPRARPWFCVKQASQLRKGVYLVDAGVGSVLPDALARAEENGVLSVRVNLWPALSGALVAAHESARVCRESFGWGTLAGVDVVAGGALGQAGTVVVDSVSHPRRVIGVADGRGGISFDYQDLELERVRTVSAEIQRQLLGSSVGG